MTVVLLILKILGILLLALLALLLLTVLLVLFVPVRYRAKGSYLSKLTLTVRVSFLLHAVTFGLDMLPGNNDMYLRILCFKKILMKADNTEEFEDTIEETAEKEAEAAAGEAKAAADAFVEEAVDEKAAGRQSTKTHEKSGAASQAAGLSGKASEDTKAAGAAPEKKRRRILSPSALLQGVRDFLARMRAALQGLRAAILRATATAERIRRLLADEDNRQALRFLGGRMFLLLKKLAPGRISLDLAYSTGSPDTTGELLGVLALFPMAYQQGWNIAPDFTADHFYADAKFDVQGRIFAFQVLGIAISVLLDKNCRKLYNELKNGS